MLKLSTSKTRRSALISVLAACAAIGTVEAPANAKQLGHVAPIIDGGGCTNCWSFGMHSAAGSPSYRVPAVTGRSPPGAPPAMTSMTPRHDCLSSGADPTWQLSDAHDERDSRHPG